MKLTTFLVALASLDFVMARSIPAGLASNTARALLKRGADVVWEPSGAYSQHKRSRKRKKDWEEKCGEALTKAGCEFGIIHKGEIGFVRDGQHTSYINVEGAPSRDVRPAKKMHVFLDGTSQEVSSWSWRDRAAMTEAKRRPRGPRGPSYKNKFPQRQGNQIESSGVRLSWDPAQAYTKRPKRKAHWEQVCGQVLSKEDCPVGIIHQGEVGLTKADGNRSFFLHVEGVPSADTEPRKKMRVFEDGSSEHGWFDQYRASMLRAKRSRGPDRARLEYVKVRDHVESTGPQTPTQGNAKHGISWDPPYAYQRLPHIRKSYEEACRRAFEREGCVFGTIHQGHHKLENPDGTRRPYMNVTTVKKDDPDGFMRYMRLFEDGSSWWYPRDKRLPRNDSRRHKGTALIKAPGTRAWERKYPSEWASLTSPTHHEASTSAQAQETTASVQTQGASSTNTRTRSLPTQVPSPGRFQEAGTGGFDLNFPPADTGQLDLNLPPTQALSPGRS